MRWNLVTSEGSVWASYDKWHSTDLKSSIVAGGHTYKWRQVSGPSTKDSILKWLGGTKGPDDDTRDLVDAVTSRQALRVIGHHGYCKATMQVISPGHTIELPVRGRKPKNGMMSAIDESDNHLIEYRLNYSRNGGFNANPNSRVEIAVTPIGMSLPGIQLLVAVTFGCLSSYYYCGEAL
jgi:hypothetical protein